MIRTAPNVIGSPRVDPVASDFDILVYNHGVDVIWESAVVCPCKVDGRGHIPTCKSCGGIGYVFINPVRTRMVLQSMNATSKFKDWTQEKMGMVTITPRVADFIGDMDRISVLDSISKMSQVVRPNFIGGTLFAFTSYPVKSVIDIFKFVGVDVPLLRLTGTDYTFTAGTNKILFNTALYEEGMSITVRYKHQVQYYVVDLTRESRQNTVSGTLGADSVAKFPPSAVGRRCHYVLRPDDFGGSPTIDNSYE